MEASSDSLNVALDLIAEFAHMRGRTCLEVTRAVLATRTLANLGYLGNGHLTQRQCEAAIAILRNWIRRSDELHQQGDAVGKPDS